MNEQMKEVWDYLNKNNPKPNPEETKEVDLTKIRHSFITPKKAHSDDN